VRSQQTSESSGSGSATPTGIPGAASNQPPVPATAPINGTSAPLQAAGMSTTGANNRRDAVTNYELDRTVRVVRSATGNIRRLTAAVVINHRPVTDPKSKATSEPIPQEELDKLTALVRESIGADDKRGDSIKVINTPFQPVKEVVDETPLWRQPDTIDLVRTLAVPMALMVAALAVVFGAIRPAIQAARTPAATPESEAQRLSAVVDDPQELPAIQGGNGPVVAGADGELPALEAPGVDQRLENARKLARENPLAVANVMRGWMNA
jgi:flagellar M-ring protein FliF